MVMQHSLIPVLGHGEGICHVYVHSDADLQKAIDVAYDSKVQYAAVWQCHGNLLVHEEIAPIFLPPMLAEFRKPALKCAGAAHNGIGDAIMK